MIDTLVSHTVRLEENIGFCNWERINDLDLSFLSFEKIIENRTSFREFSNKKNLDLLKIKEIFKFVTSISAKIINNPEILQLCFFDTQCLIEDIPKLYIFNEDNFFELELQQQIGSNNLFLQPEMHSASGVLIFLWNNEFLNSVFKKNTHQYREVIMISGYLGYLASIYGEKNNVKGTVFAGVIQKEWELFLKKQESTPIFAYAFELQKEEAEC